MRFIRSRNLESIPSSQLDILGWSGLYRRLNRSPFGVLVLGSPQRPEGVLLTPYEYARLIQLAEHRQARGRSAFYEFG